MTLFERYMRFYLSVLLAAIRTSSFYAFAVFFVIVARQGKVV